MPRRRLQPPPSRPHGRYLITWIDGAASVRFQYYGGEMEARAMMEALRVRGLKPELFRRMDV